MICSRSRETERREVSIRITGELELGEQARSSIREVLTQYELDLDRALIRRNDTYDTMRGQFGGGRGGFDPDAIGDLMEKSRDASRRVREVNERYARQIGGLLGEDLRAGFDKRVREASFPQVYRETRAQRALSAAGGFEDLSEQQGERIEALASGFGRERPGLRLSSRRRPGPQAPDARRHSVPAWSGCRCQGEAGTRSTRPRRRR